MKELEEFIQTTKDSRELKRALAVKMTLAKRPWAVVMEDLGVSHAFISKWRSRYKHARVQGLRRGYQGSQGYLSPPDKAEVLSWIQRQTTWSVRAVAQHVQATYGISYKSLQSYYALLDAARMSWKKSQDRQPKAAPQKVAAKRDVIKKTHTRKRQRLS
jgi:putative transposase